MSKRNKLLNKALNNPAGLSFEEFKTILQHCDWHCDRQVGSHEIWYSPAKHRISIQNRSGKAKEYQVKQFLLQYTQENGHE